MDEYLGEITQAHIGRVRPPFFHQMFVSQEIIGYGMIGKLGIDFLRACNNGDFREYYFNERSVRLRWRDFINYVILYCEPPVFEYTIKTFRKQFENFTIRMFRDNDRSKKSLFEYASIVSRNPYTERVFHWSKVMAPHIKDEDIPKMLLERGFTAGIFDNDGQIAACMELRIFGDDQN